VRGFKPEVWDENKVEIVVEGNFHKFSQAPELKEFLLNTKDRILVEASPYDKIWGIGLNAQAEGIENPDTWKGQNLLGFALMEVRDQLLK
ncbi:MAG: NADAR family protein, partial [Bacteroidota bacterium]